MQPHSIVAGGWITASGGVLFAIGAALPVWNLWRTFDAADARERARAQAEGAAAADAEGVRLIILATSVVFGCVGAYSWRRS